MLPYIFEFDVHIFDTDCYGVFWHGGYAKWLEMGRVDFFKASQVDMKVLSDDHDIIFPVVEQNVKFRASSRFGERLRLTTTLAVQEPKLVFHQTIDRLDDGKRIIDAQTDVVLINNQGRLYRRFPDIFKTLLKPTEA